MMEYVEKMKSLAGVSKSFGESEVLPNGATYVDAMNKFDGRPVIAKAISEKTGVDITKAQSIGVLSSGTTDLSLIPVYVDPTIVDVTRRLTPLVELIPRVTNYGRTADYNRLTARGITGWQVEDFAPTESNDTYARASTSLKYLYSVGRVTGPLLAASRQYLSQQYVDALNLEVRNKTISLRYSEEDTLINGDATTTRTAYGGITTVTGVEPSGMRKLISTNASNETSTPTLTIDMLREAIRKARTAGDSTTLGQGDPNLIVTDFGTLDTIKGLLQNYQRYVNTNYEIAWGLKTLEFEGLPVVASKFMPMTTGSREFLVLSTDTWQMRVLQDVTYEELAKTNDSYKFMLKCYEAPICTAEEFNSRYYNLT